MENKVTCLSKWSVISFAVLAFTESLLIPLVVYRICYQSTSAFVPSQCVNCPFLALQGYSFSCFGNTAFPRNMTPSQAQCMIQRCQNGVKQTPVYLGRKKRDDIDPEDFYTQSKQIEEENQDVKSSEKIQVEGEIFVHVDQDFEYDEMF